MMRIGLTVAADHCVTTVKVQGHALGRGSENLACAMASSALRGFGLWVTDQPGLRPEGRADSAGDWAMRVGDLNQSPREKWGGASELLLRQLRDIQSAYPSEVELIVEVEEIEHGS